MFNTISQEIGVHTAHAFSYTVDPDYVTLETKSIAVQ
jgi:hypothetical protein